MTLYVCFTFIFRQFHMLMLISELVRCPQSVNKYAYKIFSLSHGHQFDLFLDFWPQLFHIQISKKSFPCAFFMCCILQRI